MSRTCGSVQPFRSGIWLMMTHTVSSPAPCIMIVDVAPIRKFIRYSIKILMRFFRKSQ